MGGISFCYNITLQIIRRAFFYVYYTAFFPIMEE